MLETAVVDICTLVATCHAVRAHLRDGTGEIPDGRRRRIRRQLRRGTLAYLGTLARAMREEPDAGLLARCRQAAEQEMPDAITEQDWLARIMRGEPGALEGLAAARQDLWRLSQLAARLREGVLASGHSNAVRVKPVARRSRRRLRRALVAYADAILRAPGATGRQIAKARRRALAEIGASGQVDARQLADIEAARGAPGGTLLSGLVKALGELALDWGDPKPAA